jgi:hypothetical protein
MSSATSSFAQKSGRSKFLLGISQSDSVDSAFTLPTTVTIPKSVVGLIEFGTLGASSYEIDVGDLFKDLGRQIVIVDDVVGSPRLEVYRECMLVSGPTSEGISSNEEDVRIFVKVFSSSGTDVGVARTG